MKGNKSLIKANNLSPSVESSRDFKKISQIFDVKNFSQKTETPFILIVCNQFLDILGFDTLINERTQFQNPVMKISVTPLHKIYNSILI